MERKALESRSGILKKAEKRRIVRETKLKKLGFEEPSYDTLMMNRNLSWPGWPGIDINDDDLIINTKIVKRK